jgi:alginate O-acetyltransferase complex protein AlgI
MLFGTPVFALAFLPATLLGFHLLSGRSPPVALAFLIGASSVFYAWGRLDDLPLLIGSILANFLHCLAVSLGRTDAAGSWPALPPILVCSGSISMVLSSPH